MKGLLLKDWYQVRTNMKTMYLTVAFVLVIWVLSTSSAYVFPVHLPQWSLAKLMPGSLHPG